MDLMEKLLKKDIVVYCAAGYGEKIFLKLVSAGCNVVGFCDNAERNKGVFLFGKPIHNYQECRQKYPQVNYVIANSTYLTAIKIGEELEQDGYIKDTSYFLAIELELQDLLPSENIGVSIILKERPFVLFGNLFLCSFFEKWTRGLAKDSDIFICPSEEEIAAYKDRYTDAVWIPLESDISGIFHAKANKGTLLVQSLQNHGIKSFSRFFLGNLIYCEEECSACNRKDIFTNNYGALVKKVFFLKQSSHSGSLLLDSILDFHPNILYLGLNAWSMNIWYIIKKVIEKKEDYIGEIIRQIKAFLVLSNSPIEWLEKYGQILKGYIKDKETYTERDLFVIIHLANFELLHGYTLSNQKQVVIYMDIHSNMIMRDTTFSWLSWMGFEIVLLEMIREPYKRLGSNIKYIMDYEKLTSGIVLGLLYGMSGETVDKSEKQYPLVRIRFEDLKMYPKIILSKLCQIMEIPWDDSLLETTMGGKESVYIANGERVTGYDLKSVYHPYEEYFDAFDKFRLALLFREKNKAYGYSYVDKNKYWMSLEGFGKLFEIPFQFENFMFFQDEIERKNYHEKIGVLCTQILYMEENKEKYAGYFQFGKYLEAEES